MLSLPIVNFTFAKQIENFEVNLRDGNVVFNLMALSFQCDGPIVCKFSYEKQKKKEVFFEKYLWSSDQ